LVFMGGLLLSYFTSSDLGIQVAWLGVIIFSIVAVFSLITLPVEFDASHRAKALLQSYQFTSPGEAGGVTKGVDDDELTYVAGVAQSLSTLLYYVFILTGMGGRRRR